MRFTIFENYDPQKPPVGFVEINDDISREALANCVISPEVKVGVEPHEVISFGIFWKESLDLRSRA